MKQTTLLLLNVILFMILASSSLQAQTSEFKNGLGVRAGIVDYYAPISGKYFTGENTAVAFEYHYSRFLNKSFNFHLPLKVGHARYPKTDSIVGSQQTFGSLDAAVVYKLNNDYIFRETSFIAPYLFLGVGAEYLEKEVEKLDVQVPLGLGLNFRLSPEVYLSAQSEYRLGLLKGHNSLEHSIGLTYLFGGNGAKEPKIEEPADRDNDGISDDKDNCPDVAGLAKFSGCPDTDGDGVTDAKDNCPNKSGPADNDGCPYADKDNDGVADNLDGCPDEFGPKANKGCPYGDKDNDGVKDNVDKCPEEKGVASNNGCPEVKDADGDGVADALDKCPSVPGLATNNGCPAIVDTDGDGVADNVDRCPSVVGEASNGGCPRVVITDTDGDGVADKDDRCPSVFGTAAAKGCPEIKQEERAVLDLAMRSVEFETGSNVIKTISYSALDQVSDIMARYPNYSLSISGYTDSVGDSGSNQRLSERRAKACFDYLVRKGVGATRMSYAGYGEASPIDTNDTKEGRARNRRVEFRIFIR